MLTQCLPPFRCPPLSLPDFDCSTSLPGDVLPFSLFIIVVSNEEKIKISWMNNFFFVLQFHSETPSQSTHRAMCLLTSRTQVSCAYRFKRPADRSNAFRDALIRMQARSWWWPLKDPKHASPKSSGGNEHPIACWKALHHLFRQLFWPGNSFYSDCEC